MSSFICFSCCALARTLLASWARCWSLRPERVHDAELLLHVDVQPRQQQQQLAGPLVVLHTSCTSCFCSASRQRHHSGIVQGVHNAQLLHDVDVLRYMAGLSNEQKGHKRDPD